MYRPPHFREDRLDVLHALMRAHPLATLVTAGTGGIGANPIPFLIEDGGQHGVLHAHLARANGQLEALRAGAEALVIFQGPQAYVSPSWYALKEQTHKVVPTWNYTTAHVYGTLVVHDDTEWVDRNVRALTARQERDRDQPWSVDDAPEAFHAGQLRAIVGVELRISRVEAKFKMSQNQKDDNIDGVIAGLAHDGRSDVAELVEQLRPDRA